MTETTTKNAYFQEREKRIAELEEQVNDLVKRGLKRRAATLCLELIEAANTSAQRQRFAQLRGMLIRSSSTVCINQQSWYLAGNYTGDA